MNSKKLMLYVLLIVLALTLLYNIFISPYLLNYSSSRMHMGMRAYNNIQGYVLYRSVLIVLIGIAILFSIIAFGNSSNSKLCPKCGAEIEKNNWKICPMCGVKIRKETSDMR